MRTQRFIATLLLGIFLLQCFGLSLLGSWQLVEHRAAMRMARLEMQPHHTFRATEVPASCWKNAHEFELKGKRYDVLQTLVTEAGIVYQVVADNKEDQLRARKALAEQQSQQSNEKQSGHAIKKGVDQYVSLLPRLALLNPSVQTIAHTFYTASYTDVAAELQTPPPRKKVN